MYKIYLRAVPCLLLLYCFTNKQQEQTNRWGLIGIANELVFDETEISAGEWLEFMFYQNSTFKDNPAKSSYLNTITSYSTAEVWLGSRCVRRRLK